MATIEQYQKQYNDAKAKGDTAGMKAAHAGAEAVRAKAGYSGGTDGSQYIPIKSTPSSYASTIANGAAAIAAKTKSAAKAPSPVTAPTPAPQPAIKQPAAVAQPIQAVNPVQIVKPVEQTNGAANAALLELIKNYLATQKTNQQAIAAQRAALSNQLTSTMSSDNYNAILDKVLAANMPAYNVSKNEINTQYADKANTIDADAERRGIYNSGIATYLQDKNEADKAAAIARALAETKATAAQQAQNAVTQQLQGLGLQGDWLSSDAGLMSNDVKNAIASLVSMGGLNNETQKILNDYNLGISGANIDQQKVNNDLALGKDQNAINRSKVENDLLLGADQNNINRDKMQNDYNLGQGQLVIDNANANTAKKNAETQATQVANNYDIANKQLIMSQNELTEKARQFDLSRADDLSKFAQTIGLNWAQLGAQERASVAEAGYRNAMINLETRKFNSEQDLIKAQQAKDQFAETTDAYKMLTTAIESVRAGNGSVDDLYTLIKPYQSLNGSLHTDLKSTIDNLKNSMNKSTTGNTSYSPTTSRSGSPINDAINSVKNTAGYLYNSTWSDLYKDAGPYLSNPASITNPKTMDWNNALTNITNRLGKGLGIK